MNMDQNPPQTSENDSARPPETTTMFGEIEEIEDDVGREYRLFKNFEVVSQGPSDHHYHMQSQWMKLMHRQAFRKRMEEEWRLLQEHIPSSIYVRAYEPRIDLMRAAFVAPPGSDCEHCLFFFDIYFPVNYPRAPPNLHYLSYGVDCNPNLRPDGRVCLDTRESWHDRFKQIWPVSNNKEKWNPEEFNILQVLHAIQNLISYRSPKPSRPSLCAISGPLVKHNTKAFASACEKMTRVLRKPPLGFEWFVAGHFRQRAHPILLKFKENNYDDKIMVDLFIRMFTVFERNGAYCEHHLDFLKSRTC